MNTLLARRFFVVIHTITNGLHHAFGEAKVAQWAGADGIFLIPDYAKGPKKATIDDQFLYLEKLKSDIPDFLIGVNFLASPESLIPKLYSVQPHLYQTDSSSSERVDKTRLPTTEFFLGLAFKYSGNVHLTGSALKEHCEKVGALADVPTTSGDATGIEADINKIRGIRSYLPADKRLGIASGVTQENILPYLKEGVTDFLVATSLIESVNEDGADVLSSHKISYMAETIHSYRG